MLTYFNGRHEYIETDTQSASRSNISCNRALVMTQKYRIYPELKASSTSAHQGHTPVLQE
ncbi:hypothetical protein J6590_097225 [Homalodisca vitripennis]|nr:hypothetical protein J6590_097225 [Homalodisca vitripennis]